MNIRIYVVCIYLLAFILIITAILSIPGYYGQSVPDYWQSAPDWSKMLHAFFVLSGFLGLVLACWVYEDGVSLNRLEDRLQGERTRLEQRISDLEKKNDDRGR